MRISSKRQIAIPKKIMETMDLKPGDEVEFEVEKGMLRLVPTKTIKIPRRSGLVLDPGMAGHGKGGRPGPIKR